MRDAVSPRAKRAALATARAIAVSSLALGLGLACGGSSTLPVAPRASQGAHEALPATSASQSDPASASASTATSTSELASASPSEPGSASPSELASASPSELATASSSAPAPPALVCNPQQPFDFLLRKNYIPVGAKKAAHDKALEFRTRHYGRAKEFGDASWNATAAKDHTVSITLFGLPVTVHEKIVPALRCAEAEVKATCGAAKYTPGVLAGIRDRNTYRGGEVTNHLFGIAVDIDPLLNSCCGCVTKWKASPLCKKKAKTIWERMSMPKCWVDAFEKYGFYWLGHDKLKDTMHFEFLADPDRVMVPPSALAANATSSVASKESSASADVDDDAEGTDDDPYEDVAPPPAKASPPPAKKEPAKTAAPAKKTTSTKKPAKPAGKPAKKNPPKKSGTSKKK